MDYFFVFLAVLRVKKGVRSLLGGEFVGGAWTPPDGDVNFDDIDAAVHKFRNLAGAPSKTWADIAGDPPKGIPDQLVNFVDIAYVVDGFRGVSYQFDPPEACP